MTKQDETITVAISIRPAQQAIVRELADRLFDGNFSMALRVIISQWYTLTHAQEEQAA